MATRADRPRRWWRLRAACGLIGPAAFTAAWAASSSRQDGLPMSEVHISSLGAPDARDPMIMVGGFVALGGCMAAFASALREALDDPGHGRSDHGGPDHGRPGHGRSVGAGLAPLLISAGGIASVAAGLMPRESVVAPAEGTSHLWTWHSLSAGVAYTSLVAVPLVLADRFRHDPEWERFRRPALVVAVTTVGLLLTYLSQARGPYGGVLQRVAVTVPLTAMALLAVWLLARRPHDGAGGQGKETGEPAAAGPGRTSGAPT